MDTTSLGQEKSAAHLWFPFTVTEAEVVIGIAGFLLTVLSLFDVDRHELAMGTVAYLALVYLAGLLVQTRRGTRTFRFIEDGGLKGEGYVQFFRGARRSLFLTHVDDDAPSDELLGLYRSLLDRGVQMRRVLFLRGNKSGKEWVVRFGEHENLTQRMVPPGRADILPLSFVVVDEEVTVVSVPGYGAIDAGTYAPDFLLRHLLVIRDSSVAKVFLEMHRQLWDRAEPIGRLKDLLLD